MPRSSAKQLRQEFAIKLLTKIQDKRQELQLNIKKDLFTHRMKKEYTFVVTVLVDLEKELEDAFPADLAPQPWEIAICLLDRQSYREARQYDYNNYSGSDYKDLSKYDGRKTFRELFPKELTKTYQVIVDILTKLVREFMEGTIEQDFLEELTKIEKITDEMLNRVGKRRKLRRFFPWWWLCFDSRRHLCEELHEVRETTFLLTRILENYIHILCRSSRTAEDGVSANDIMIFKTIMGRSKENKRFRH